MFFRRACGHFFRGGFSTCRMSLFCQFSARLPFLCGMKLFFHIIDSLQNEAAFPSPHHCPPPSLGFGTAQLEVPPMRSRYRFCQYELDFLFSKRTSFQRMKLCNPPPLFSVGSSRLSSLLIASCTCPTPRAFSRRFSFPIFFFWNSSVPPPHFTLSAKAFSDLWTGRFFLGEELAIFLRVFFPLRAKLLLIFFVSPSVLLFTCSIYGMSPSRKSIVVFFTDSLPFTSVALCPSRKIAI